MDLSKNREQILSGNMWRTMLMLAVPVMTTNLIQTIYGLVDTFFIARLGTSQVAAVQLSFPINFLTLSLGMGMSIAATSMIAQYAGRKDYAQARRVASQILIVNAILSLFLGLLGTAFLKPLLHIIGVSESLMPYTYPYLAINLLGLPTLFLMFAYNGIRNGSGDTVSPMILNTAGVILTIILDPILIFGMNLGVAGGAWAVVISRGIFTSYALYRMFTKPGEMKLSLSDLKIEMNHIRRIVAIGLPSSFGQAMEAIGFIVMNMYIVDLGEITLTAFSIGNRINGLILMPAMGIGGALATIIGQNLGAGQLDRARQAVKSAVIIATGILILGGIPMIIWAKPVVGIFSQDAAVIAQGSHYLILITLSIPLMGFFNVFSGTFQGSGHTMLTMFMQLGRLWVLRIPMIILFKALMPGDPSAIWYSMILSNFLTATVGYLMYKTDRWTIPVIKGKPLAQSA
jgi:putative MATE family efflux protein